MICVGAQKAGLVAEGKSNERTGAKESVCILEDEPYSDVCEFTDAGRTMFEGHDGVPSSAYVGLESKFRADMQMGVTYGKG